MKKTLLIFIILLGVIHISFEITTAQMMDHETVNVVVHVLKYAKIDVLEPMTFGEVIGDGSGTPMPADFSSFTIETNTALDLLYSATDLSHNTSTIDTYYQVIKTPGNISLGYVNRNPDFSYKGDLFCPNYQLPKTKVNYHLFGWAKWGKVSSHEYGSYTAAITLTITATP